MTGTATPETREILRLAHEQRRILGRTRVGVERTVLAARVLGERPFLPKAVCKACSRGRAFTSPAQAGGARSLVRPVRRERRGSDRSTPTPSRPTRRLSQPSATFARFRV